MAKIDWVEAQKDYVSDPTMSYQKIADKYGLARQTVEERALKEAWVETRKRLGEKALQKAEMKLVDEKSEINDRHGKTYMNLQALLLEQLNSYITYTRATVQNAKDENRILTPRELHSAQQIMFLANGLKTAIDGERVAKGLPTAFIKNDTDVKLRTDLSDLSDQELERIVKAGEDADSDLKGD